MSIPTVLKNTVLLKCSPGDGEPDLVCNSQDPLQVLGAEGAGFPEGDSRGKALNDD